MERRDLVGDPFGSIGCLLRIRCCHEKSAISNLLDTHHRLSFFDTRYDLFIFGVSFLTGVDIESSGHPVLSIITNSLSTDQRDKLQKILKQANEGGEQVMKGHIQEAVQASRSWAQEIS
jgi:hypothetical protein